MVKKRPANIFLFFDVLKKGTVSSKGKVNRDVLAKMYHLGNSFLSQQSGPRSTGRELFGMQFSRAIVESFPSVDAADLIATAVEFTAETLWMAVRRSQRRPSLLIVSGGGAKNPSIMSRLIGEHFFVQFVFLMLILLCHRLSTLVYLRLHLRYCYFHVTLVVVVPSPNREKSIF